MKPSYLFQEKMRFYPGCAGQTLGLLNMNIISSECTHWKVLSKIVYSKGYNHLIPGAWFPIRMKPIQITVCAARFCIALHFAKSYFLKHVTTGLNASEARRILTFGSRCKNITTCLARWRQVIEARFGWVSRKQQQQRQCVHIADIGFPCTGQGDVCGGVCASGCVCWVWTSLARVNDCVINISGPSGAICFSSMCMQLVFVWFRNSFVSLQIF